MLTWLEKAMKRDRKPKWTHYSQKDLHFWRAEDGTTTACGKTSRRIQHTNVVNNVTCRRCINALDICGYCGEPEADKMALWTGSGLYWPGEFVPESELVHAECENEETQRAHSALTPGQRNLFLNGIG